MSANTEWAEGQERVSSSTLAAAAGQRALGKEPTAINLPRAEPQLSRLTLLSTWPNLEGKRCHVLGITVIPAVTTPIFKPKALAPEGMGVWYVPLAPRL